MNLDRFGFKVLTKDKRWIIYSLETRRKFRMFWHDIKKNVCGRSSRYDIDTTTICQCTGLKDSDGKLIYENDYFEIIDSGHVTGRYIVQYHPKSMHFQIKNAYIDTDFSDLSFVPMWMEYGRKVRVIGNWFDKENKNV